MKNTNKKNHCQANNSPRFSTGDEKYKSFVNTFVKRNQHPIISFNNRGWEAIDFLYDYYILSHLNHKNPIGCRGKEYPQYSIIDNDDISEEILEYIRDELDLKSNNSMLSKSPGSLRKDRDDDPDSYHTLYKPLLNGEPVHLKQLQNAWKPYIKHIHKIFPPKSKNKKIIEIFPKSDRGVRLPFSTDEIYIDKDCIGLDGHDLIDRFDNNIETFDIAIINSILEQFPEQLEIDLDKKTDPDHRQPDDKNIPSDPEISDDKLKKALFNNPGHAEYLYKNGLPDYHCRSDSNYELAIYFWNQGYSPESVFEMIWRWDREKHNGKSKSILESPGKMRAEVERQVNYIFDHYPLLQKFPNYIHNSHYGWITKDDLIEIVIRCKGNMPLAKFLYYLVSHKNPRRKHSFQGVYCKTLMGWNKEYIKHIRKLESYDIIKRDKTFTRGGMHNGILREGKSKEITLLNWKIRDIKDAIFNNGRSPDTLYDHFRLKLQPHELRQLLESAGCERHTAIDTVKRVYSTVVLAISEGYNEEACLHRQFKICVNI